MLLKPNLIILLVVAEDYSCGETMTFN